MPDPHDQNDLPLFRDTPQEVPAVTVPRWRPTPADNWTRKPPSPAALENYYPDLLRRSLEFIEALDRTAGVTTTPEIQGFRERHERLVDHFVEWRATGSNAEAAAGTTRLALEIVEELSDLRRRILDGLDPGRRREVLALEARGRIPDREVERAVALAELRWAEKQGDIVELDIPAHEDPWPSAGLLGFDSMDVLVQAYAENMKAQQERRPLPAAGRLATLLKEIPVEWLDAIWQALDLGPERPRHRKERERVIARHLLEEGTLRRIVDEKLSEKERELLNYLLERDGRASAATVTRRFESDRGDGWFWNEVAPTSALGRIRLHGLAFVGGATATGRRTRAVLVPRELRDPLRAALVGAGRRAHENEAPRTVPARPLRPEIIEALEAAFPEGVVEPAGDDSYLDEILERLRRELSRLAGSRLVYERTIEGVDFPNGVPASGLDDLDDAELEPGDETEGWDELECSYGLFFLAPRDERFRFPIEAEFTDEDGRVHATSGTGQLGWAVAVSELAPVALLRLTSLDAEDELGTVPPDIVPRWFDDQGRPQSEEHFHRERLGAEAGRVLDHLRERIVRVLTKFGIAVLLEEEAGTPVPGLEASDEVLAGGEPGEPLTVEDAFFFRYL